MAEIVDVYVFRSAAGWGANTNVCVAAINRLVTPNEIDTIFFGHVRYRNASGEELIGVWGARNAARLRRMLKERGAQIVVHHEPPGPRVSWRTKGKARADAAKS
jgi:hypothetical protein